MGLSAAAWIAIGSTAASTAVSLYSADQARSSSNKAQDRAKAAADDREQQFNKLNGKTPDVDAMSAANAMDAKAGQSGTLLTGPEGVDPSKLLLGRQTLLGSGG